VKEKQTLGVKLIEGQTWGILPEECSCSSMKRVKTDKGGEKAVSAISQSHERRNPV